MVENNDVESAMKVLNGIMAQEGLYRRWMGTRRYETPTVARRRINFQRGKAVYHEDISSFPLYRTIMKTPHFIGNFKNFNVNQL